jgi:hypothetical protein
MPSPTRMLDTTRFIDLDDPAIREALESDLRRIDLLKHESMPAGADKYILTILPSNRTYNPKLMRKFRFEIRYGKINENNRFEFLGRPVEYTSETLPVT